MPAPGTVSGSTLPGIPQISQNPGSPAASPDEGLDAVFVSLTGNAADDVYAISAGTGQKLTVDQSQIQAASQFSGAIQINMQGASTVFLTGLSLTGNASLSIVGAAVPSTLIVELTANGHTLTDPTGTLWPNNNTVPTPSGAEDLYGYIILAATAGVPTKIRGTLPGQAY